MNLYGYLAHVLRGKIYSYPQLIVQKIKGKEGLERKQSDLNLT